MSGILNVGARALQANQVALQTAGNNIANVNTPGYSRQSVVLQTVEGQFTGGGYIGKGVEIKTIQRNFSSFLTRQSALAGSTQSGDATRADKLKQLEGIFPGGNTGLGAAVSDMLNAFSDVATAPTDLTARTVVLTRVDETAKRMRATSQLLDDLQLGVTQEIDQKLTAVNSLAHNIADVNGQISRAQGSGQSPNDLLDKRDQLVRELNVYVQTTSIPADDGTVGIFIGGSQALVIGTSVSEVSLVQDNFGDPLKSKLAINRSGTFITMDENALGGGEVSGLLRFQNTDLVEGRNLLGRLTLAISSSMNTQHHLGLDLDGNAGGDIFSPIDITNNVLPDKNNLGTGSLTLSISDASKFAASDYEVVFSDATTGSVTRLSDKVATAFTFDPGAGTFLFFNPATNLNDLDAIDGLSLAAPSAPGSGDRFLIKPFSTSASDINSAFSTPRALAVASPVVGSMGAGNSGSLQQVLLQARSNNPTINVPVTLTFIGPSQYTRSDDPDPTAPIAYTYTPGQAIESNLPLDPNASPYTYATPLTGWSLTLQGSAKTGDTFKILDIKDPTIKVNLTLNSGNASAMMGLRDAALFDGSALTDGYASLISQIGIRTQSATYTAAVSGSIAANLERDRASVSGVNLDEEAANLLQYQQAYQASAKLIQIAQSIFDTLIQTLGR